MLPIDKAAPSLAAVDHVTPVGAVDSLAIVCSVPLTALVPNAILIAVSADGVFVEIQTLALCNVRLAEHYAHICICILYHRLNFLRMIRHPKDYV